MSSEWYIQHGGKQHGPLSAAQLKKLAAERKITPATSVRLGASGNWVSASKVQGLFGPAPQSPPAVNLAAQTAPPPPQAAPVVVPKAQPLAAAPPAVPVGMAPPPWAKPAAAPVAPAHAGVGAKVLGAVGIIFGAVALATFWLPVLGGPIGWTGIVAGALGLLVAIAGLVVAAMSHGAGLLWNVAGASGSAVGLVLAVVLGISFGLFTTRTVPELPMVVQRPALPPAIEPMPPPVEPEPQPAPPPELVWTDAAEAIVQGPIKATIASAGIEQVRMEDFDISKMTRPKPRPMLKVRLNFENQSSDRIVEVPGWAGGGDLIGQGVGELLGAEAGKALQAATATAVLTDNVGNKYKQAPAALLTGGGLDAQSTSGVRPGQSRPVELIFDPPLESVEYLRLELSPAGFSGTDALRFQIQRPMIKGLPPAAGG